MKFNVSYKAQIIKLQPTHKFAIIDTINIYRKAITYLIPIVNSNYETIETLKGKERNNFIEKLIHSTKDNKSSYDFDIKFYKFPSYLRRIAIQDALGIVSSYKNNFKNYLSEKHIAISNGKKFKKKEPKLTLKHFKCPTLYNGNMYAKITDNTVKIKVLIKNDWNYITINLKKSDINYILKNCYNYKINSPILIKKGKNVYLSYSFSGETKINNTNLKNQKILAVDLGINTSATCSILNFDGTVRDRLFINQKSEKDHQNHLINRLKKKQKQGSISASNKSLRAKINGLNNFIVNDTVNKIVNFAAKNKVDVIVFEYLDFKKNIKSKDTKNLKTKLHLWAKRKIQNKVEEKAHTFGVRFRRVNPKNTSALAFDGSGKVKRDKHNHSLCIFKNNKQYNCDLSASYNIGARYFIKEINKTISEKKWSEVVAKVPQLSVRTNTTLSTLISLIAVL